MNVFSDIPVLDCPTAIATGSFDGVHPGHRLILNRVKEYAVTNGCQSVALTFWPHPKTVVGKDRHVKLLNTLEEKVSLLKGTGVDKVIVCPFTEEFSLLSGEDFVRDFLKSRLKMKALVMGENHHLGNPVKTGQTSIKDLSEKYSFSLLSLPLLGSNPVSSSSIRNSLALGDAAMAEDLLGYPYFVSGVVKKGQNLGHSLGFPTANLEGIDKIKVLPKPGAYAVNINIEVNIYDGMMNLGYRPTVSDNSSLSAEVNIFGFDGNLYDRDITVYFRHRLRDEIRFDSLEKLRLQLSEDKVLAKFLLKNCLPLSEDLFR